MKAKVKTNIEDLISLAIIKELREFAKEMGDDI